jgi:hypothetical protein
MPDEDGYIGTVQVDTVVVDEILGYLDSGSIVYP